jgi:hypothetical protein
MNQTRTSRNLGAIALVALIVVMLAVVFYVFPPWDVATDAPDKAQHAGMAQMPVALWWIGSGILATALIYGILHTRHRSPGERRRSEEGTKRVYEEEEKAQRDPSDERFKTVRGMPE